jgi:ankyrin repeat protein
MNGIGIGEDEETT